VCALSYFLERTGLMTTGISLVRENTAHMKPPRALWVSFPLGRPLGKPDDAAFQHRVIEAALTLLTMPNGPVLADFPEDAPLAGLSEAPACPVSFSKPSKDTDSWKTKLLDELQSLLPWHDLGLRRRAGRSLVGVSGFSMTENIEKLGILLDNQTLPITELKWFKNAIEDAKVFYLEALTAQPGRYNQDQLEKLIWHETTLGAALLKFNDLFIAHPELSYMARIITPRTVLT